MSHPDVVIRSALPGLAWPAVTAPDVATALALQYELARSQWLSRSVLDELQMRQLAALLRHAWQSVPFYRWHWQDSYAPGEPLTRARFASLPLLRREDLEREFDALRSGALPAPHGGVTESRTAGSTGAPVRTLKSALTGLWAQAVGLRDHLWHARDFNGRLAVIRPGAVRHEEAGWGPPSGMIECSGRMASCSAAAAPSAQLDWLAEFDPDCLLAQPSTVARLAQESRVRGGVPGRLREVRTFGERVAPGLRALVRDTWHARLTDAYACDEAGVLALQCPAHEHYHVQSESVLVEVLDRHDRPCPPGEPGRVVVTTLQNFAMPLVRYELGDYAEAGAACECGRGLPVLRCIAGRARNMLRTASGACTWPSIETSDVAQIAPVQQFQLVQKRIDLLEARVCAAAPLSAEQQSRLRAFVLERVPAGLQLELACVAEFPPPAGGRFEAFVSEIQVGTGG